MNYTQLFRALRESKGLTHDTLAKQAGCHRNTVINVESGRPVKFKTVVELMQQMGYDADSPEIKTIALLWLESISGIDLTTDRNTAEARKKIAKYRATEQESAQVLADSVIGNHLSTDQIRTLLFAAGRPEVIAILENMREMLASSAPCALIDEEPALRVAEL